MAVSQYQSVINQAAAAYGVSPALIASVIQTESSGNPNATSSAGAQGLMQLMPATAASLGVSNPFDPVQNIYGGTAYLAQLLNQYNGDVATALAAYNWGPGNIASGRPIPTDTQNYVAQVMGGAGGGSTAPLLGGGSGLIVNLSGDAAAAPTADIMSQLQAAGIDLNDPTTLALIALGIGAVVYAFAG